MVAMKKASTVEILNALVQLHCRSLPVYLTDAAPWVSSEFSAGKAMIESIASDQLQMADEFSNLVLSRNEIVERGAFPTEFTDLHDLSLDHVVRESACKQSRNVEALERATTLFEDDSEALTLCQKALGVAKAHLDNLSGFAS